MTTRWRVKTKLLLFFFPPSKLMLISRRYKLIFPLQQRFLFGSSEGEGASPFTGLQCGALILRYVV